jgi:hypothetical protein
MSDENITLNVSISSTDSDDLISSTIRFWLYLLFLIPSMICTLFVLYYLVFDRTLRRSLNNHVIIVLLFTVLFCELTMYPWMLYYYSHSDTWQRSFAFCVIWGFIDWAVYMLQLLLFAWASIERHILIFHDRWVSTKRKRIFVHYLPVVIISMYWFLFYAYVYFYPSCENTFDSTQMICVTVCLFSSFSFHAFDLLFNNVLPTLTIVIFSVTLLLRVLRQKQRMRQPILWRKHRKMTVQLLSISALYLLITAPWAIIVFLRICGLPQEIGAKFEDYSYFVSYYMVLIFPFVSLLSLPELRLKLNKLLQLQQRGAHVRPDPLAGRDVRTNQVAAQ